MDMQWGGKLLIQLGGNAASVIRAASVLRLAIQKPIDQNKTGSFESDTWINANFNLSEHFTGGAQNTPFLGQQSFYTNLTFIS